MEIKQGDTVRVSKDAPKMYLRGQAYFFIEDDCKVDMVEGDNAVITNGPRIIAIPPKYLVKVDAEEENKPNVGSIKIPVEVDLTDSYWNAYAADLAKEVALKVANKFNAPEQAAEYAVSVARAVVEGLKRK